MRKTEGFTLMEVMVAVLVLGIALAAIIKATAENGANLTSLRDKTLAHWVAQNKLTELVATEHWSSATRNKGRSELAGREWFWSVEIQNTPNPRLRRVTVRVAERENAESQLAVLDGFLGNPELRKRGQTVAPPAGGPGPGGGDGGGGDGGSTEGGES